MTDPTLPFGWAPLGYARYRHGTRPRQVADCGWCRPIPVDQTLPTALVQCSCYHNGQPDPCPSPRCPAAADPVDPFAPQLVSNA